MAAQRPAPLFTLMLVGHVIVGTWLSVTVTVNAQVAVLPAASVTLKVLVVAPIGKVAPLAKPAVCVVAGLGQLSVPIGEV